MDFKLSRQDDGHHPPVAKFCVARGEEFINVLLRKFLVRLESKS